MQNSSIELNLLDPEEREQVEFIYNLIPEQDRQGLTADDILFVLDAVDEYLISKGLIEVDDENGEMTYLDGEVDETEQLDFVLQAAKNVHRSLTSSQVQIILDGEMQYGLEQGWYEEEEWNAS